MCVRQLIKQYSVWVEKENDFRHAVITDSHYFNCAFKVDEGI